MTDRFEVIDGKVLLDEHRALLRPDETLDLENGVSARLPRYFYRVNSWEEACRAKLTLHFTLAELMAVDCREAPLLLRGFPHYVPCTISLLARYLETFRERADAPVFVSVNGGYRSPAHRFSSRPSLHVWGAAANIYRVGDTWLDDEKSIERYARLAESIGQEVRVKPFGHGPGETDDHLHFDIGLVHWAPA